MHGIRNTEPIADLVKVPALKEAGEGFFHVFEILEDHYADMMDIEFTIENVKALRCFRLVLVSVLLFLHLRLQFRRTEEDVLLRSRLFLALL